MNAHQFARQMMRIEQRFGSSTKQSRKALQKLVSRERAAHIIIHGKVTGFRLRDGRIVCKKRRFTSPETAVREMKHIALTSKRTRIPIRAYQCEECQGFHLTSRQ